MEKRQTAREVVDGFKEVGFIYLEKHGVPEAKVKNAFNKVSPSIPDEPILSPSSPDFRPPECRVL